MSKLFKTCQPSTMARAPFVSTFADIYEHSAWVAERAYDGTLDASHDSVEGLHRLMSAIILSASQDAQLALIRAHPDLGGKVSVALSDSSTAEQKGAGLQDCSALEFARFQELNDAYVLKFTFPFIMAVKGTGRLEILDAFEKRLHHDAANEMAKALAEINKIAFFRLEDL